MSEMITGKFGRYEIKYEIARGGMATVYHAYDPNFERDIAIKVLPQALLHDPQFRTRFEREAKVIAKLEHPAIVPVYDFGEEQGQPYIIMRYMSGGSLTERIETGPMSLSETAKIIQRLAPALDAAHAMDIIHRDLKPGNVLFDRYGIAYLSDFGIARIITENQANTITGGAIVGTPAYMSPEQIQGDKKIGGRSDIYALGVLVYQMLTGGRPYQADTTPQLLMMHIMEPVPNILNKRPDFPQTTDLVITKAMAKEPEARFATVTEFADALDLLASGQPYVQPESSAGMLITPENPELVKSQSVTVISPHSADTQIADKSKGVVPVDQIQEKKTTAKWIFPAMLTLALIAIIVVILVFTGTQGNGPLALMAARTGTPTPTSTATPLTPTKTSPAPAVVQPTATTAIILPTFTEEPTLEPTLTSTSTPATPVIGGADKIGFLKDREIWVANLDGTELDQLTADGTAKKWLQWSTDGKAIHYITGKCVKSVQLEDKQVDQLTCLNNAGEVKSFQISPDGRQVAISLDNQLYIVPYDPEKLSAATRHSDLVNMAECEHFAYYKPFFVKMAQWSRDGNAMAAVTMAATGDLIQVFTIDQCVPYPERFYSIPRNPVPDEFKQNPGIRNFGWDGLAIFAFNTLTRRNGFGNLYRYNMGLYQEGKIFSDMINPIDGRCCYRDAIFSPDGTFLLFAYEDSGLGTIRFYMIQDGLIGTGIQYEPLPLPDLSAEDESSYPILRSAKIPE